MSKEKTTMSKKPQSALVLWLKMHIYMMLVVVLAICTAIGYYYFYISRPSFEYGALHIKEIIPVKELKSWQSEMDVLVNIQTPDGKYFTTLMTTKMEAGVSMDDVKVEEDTNTIHITIPVAKNLSSSDNGEKTIRENGLNQQTIDAVKTFAKSYAEQISVQEHRLATAQKEAARLIHNFVQIIANTKNKAVDMVLVPMPDEKSDIITMRSHRTGVFISHFPLTYKWDTKILSAKDANYALYKWDSQNAKITLYSLGMVTGNSLLSPMKCAQSDQRWAQQFNPINPSLKFKMLANPANNSASFCWQAGGQVYKMDFNADDESAYQTKLPDAMMLAYGVRYDYEFQLEKGKSYALGGISRDDWKETFFIKRFAYVLDMMDNGLPFDLTFREKYHNVRTFVDTSTSKIDTSVLKQLWSSIPNQEYHNIKAIFYDPQSMSVHRPRLIALSAENIYFFIPSRIFQSQVMKQVPVVNMNMAVQYDLGWLKREDDGIWVVDGESFYSKQFNQFLDAIANRNLFNMIAFRP